MKDNSISLIGVVDDFIYPQMRKIIFFNMNDKMNEMKSVIFINE